MGAPALDEPHDVGQAEDPAPSFPESCKDEMHMVWHDHGCMQLNHTLVLCQAGIQHMNANVFRQEPSLLRGEGDEDWMVVLLEMRKSSAIGVSAVQMHDQGINREPPAKCDA
jgi:hypothetical protein